MTAVHPEMKALKKARVRKELAELDYQRQLVLALVSKRMPQREVADVLGLSQPSVSSALKTARTVPMPREGSQSASPYEVCQRYAAGELTREETMAQLVAWPYASAGDMRTSPGDDLMVWPQGTTQEVMEAEADGLIDSDMCEAVLDAVHGHA